MASNSKPRNKCFFPLGCCFGSFRKKDVAKTERNVSSDSRYDDGKFAKVGRSKKLPESDKTGLVDFLSLQKMSWYRNEVELEVEVNDHKVPVQSLPEHQNIVINYKDMILENSSRMLSSHSKSEKGTDQEAWSGPMKLSQSVSMPMPPRKNKQVTIVGGGAKEKQGNEVGAGEIDPIVGALILTVTLIVMLVWGKVSAILCTAIWFYCIPRLIRPDHFKDSYGTRVDDGSNPSNLDSLENKEKVVLQGFLDRN